MRQTPVTPLPGIIDTGGDIPVTPWPDALQEGASALTDLEDTGQLWADLYAPSLSLLTARGRFIDEEPTWLMLPAVYPDAPSTKARDKVPTKTRETGAEEQSYAVLIRNLVKSSGIYALASIASPFISLVLAPFLTRSLTHADYGILAVLNTIIALGAGITQLGLSSAFSARITMITTLVKTGKPFFRPLSCCSLFLRSPSLSQPLSQDRNSLPCCLLPRPLPARCAALRW